MRFASFRRPDGAASYGIVEGDTVVDCGGLSGGRLRHAVGGLAGLRPPAGAARHPASAITWLPPIPDPQKILCVGLNYMTHIREGGREPPPKPIIFTRFPNTQVGHLQPMIQPAVSVTFDYEGELAVVIGRSCRHVPKDEAWSVIAGYSCYNDGSVREWQRHSSQFTPGKNFPATGGFGPCLVTPDETGDITRQTLLTRLNGEEVQRATIDDLVFDIPTLIEYCSTFTSLEPGDVLVTGTTGGVGAYRDPPLWMKPGDVVQVEVTGVGVLQNPIVAET